MLAGKKPVLFLWLNTNNFPLFFYEIRFLAAPRPTLGYYRGDSLTQTTAITFLNITFII